MADRAPNLHRSPHFRFSLRGLLVAMAIVSLYVATYVTFIRDFVRHGVIQSQSLLFGAIPILVVAIVWAFQWWHLRTITRQASFILRRKNDQRYVLSSIAAPAIILLAYFIINPWLANWPPWQATIVGALVGMTVGAMLLLITILAPFITVHDKGIVIAGTHRIPWKRVRTAVLDPHDPTVLRIEFYRQHIVAVVAPEQRVALETLLKDKLADACRS